MQVRVAKRKQETTEKTTDNSFEVKLEKQQILEKAGAVLRMASGIKQKQILELKQKIKAGQYKIENEKVAGAIMAVAGFCECEEE